MENERMQKWDTNEDFDKKCIVLFVITVSRYDLGRLSKIKWSRHRSFLYGCDRSPEAYVLELGTEIPN